MQDNANWSERYYSQEALEKLKKREWTPEMQAETTQKWNDLFRDVEGALDEDPAGEKAQALAGRWGALILAFTGADPEVTRGLNNVWKDPSGLPEATQERMKAYMNPKVHEFIQKAFAAGKKR